MNFTQRNISIFLQNHAIEIQNNVIMFVMSMNYISWIKYRIERILIKKLNIIIGTTDIKYTYYTLIYVVGTDINYWKRY